MKKAIDLTSQKFGRLFVIERAGADSHGTAKWLCRCDCGTEKVIRGDKIRSGEIQSCGCLSRELRRARALSMGKKNVTHGLSYDRLYQIYQNMLRRCYEEENEKYYRYGARGICVCDEWLQDKNSFFEWALSSGYDKSLTIDRIDVDKGYSPENCKWSTPKEQANNRSTNVILKYNGESHTIAEWSDVIGTLASTLYARRDRGWSDDQILSTPCRSAK